MIDNGHANTQLGLARRGIVSEAMKRVAEREGLDAEFIRQELARGRLIIPANTRHLAGSLDPMGVGVVCSVKVNANIGNSAVTSHVDEEIKKLHMAVHHGADTVMDLSTGGDIPKIRRAIIDASPVPLGTVPIYEAILRVKRVEDLTPELMRTRAMSAPIIWSTARGCTPTPSPTRWVCPTTFASFPSAASTSPCHRRVRRW